MTNFVPNPKQDQHWLQLIRHVSTSGPLFLEDGAPCTYASIQIQTLNQTFSLLKPASPALLPSSFPHKSLNPKISMFSKLSVYKAISFWTISLLIVGSKIVSSN